MLSILIIDDTPEKISTLRDLIKESGINTEPIIAHDFREAMAKIAAPQKVDTERWKTDGK